VTGRFVGCWTRVSTGHWPGSSQLVHGIYDRALQMHVRYRQREERDAELTWLRSLPADGPIPGPSFGRFEAMGWRSSLDDDDTTLEIGDEDFEAARPQPKSEPVGKHRAILHP